MPIAQLTEDQLQDVARPLDFSFNHLKTLENFGTEGPRASRIGSVPERTPNRKYLTKAVWLNNNKLTSMRYIEELVNRALAEPAKLAYIDFSFNFLTEIDNELLKFPNLTIIYLHGNQIKDIEQAFKLRSLKRLRTVTFHGNPMCEQYKYRSYILAFLPNILNLDFSPFTEVEKNTPMPPEAKKRLQELGL
ncbi:hypothetical protein FQR65_LT00158 [Abscondita terminalis]|nr:hypothetical protein FQR65_LT00158 [Abscondita terminalis]